MTIDDKRFWRKLIPMTISLKASHLEKWSAHILMFNNPDTSYLL